MRKPRILIKLGGAALDSDASLDAAAEALRKYRSHGYQTVIVHGGGPAINAELTRRGITWSFVGGQRVTTPAMVDVIESVLCGSVNRRLVRHFGAQGLHAVGFSGADHKTLLCRQASPELGLVGAIEEVNHAWIEDLMAMPGEPIPVIAPIGMGVRGEGYNINADWAAAHLAVALGVEQLIFLTDQSGILDEEGELIANLDTRGLKCMIECKIVTGGMLTKSRSVLHAIENGISSVRILKGRDAARGFDDLSMGTLCTLPVLESVSEEAYAAV